MGDVGDVLELLHGAASRWRTVRCTVRHWRHTERSRIAMERWRLASRAMGVQMYAGDGDRVEPEEYEHEERLWIAKPDHSRLETEHHTVVTRGPTWWSWSPHHGFMTNERDQDVGTSDPALSYAAHLDPAYLIPQIEIASVELPRVRVVERAGVHHGPGLPRGADEHLLLLDDRGVVVRYESFIGGEVFHTSELVGAVWDEDIDEGVFTLEPPAGEEVLSPHELHRTLSFEEAAELASFPLYAIGELPEGSWRTDVHHHGGRRGNAAQVTVLYHRADGRGSLQLVQRDANGGHIWARPAEWAHVSVVRGSTAITLQSGDYSEGELRDLAETLVPV